MISAISSLTLTGMSGHKQPVSFGHIDERDFPHHYGLAESYIASPAFDDESWGFIRLLEKCTVDVSRLVVGTARRVIADFEKHGSAGGRRATELHALKGLILREYETTETDPVIRSQLLDVIDEMLMRDVSGARDIVQAFDR